MKKRKEKATLSASFPDGQNVQPQGFKDLSTGDTVVIVVTGRVRRTEDNAEEWSPGKHLKLEIKNFAVKTEKDPTTMDKAIKKSSHRV